MLLMMVIQRRTYDVVVLATHFFHDLVLSELWIGIGSGKWYKDIPIHHISEMLGLQRCQALPFFHAFTGCDIVSSMMGIGKKTAWNAWVKFPEATTTFTAITQDPGSLTVDSIHMRRLVGRQAAYPSLFWEETLRDVHLCSE